MAPRGRMVIPSLLTLLLVSVVAHPVALAQSAWEEDGWLRSSFALDRLEHGDEFGCYGVPGLSWANDPGAVAQSCRNYIEDRINASMWGVSPLSTYTPNTLTMADHEKISSQGFPIHGDQTGLGSTAWHNASDVPHDLWDWYNLGRRGGSLEKGIASLEDIQAEVEAGGLVNFYWVGRIHDATVRHDRDVLAFLDDTPDIWLTTWGEAWSAWSAKRCYEYQHEANEVREQTVITFLPLQKEACTSLAEDLPWNVPLTWLLDVSNEKVHAVSTDGTSTDLPNITGAKTAQEGWWQQEDGTLVLSVVNGHAVNITLNASNVEYDVIARSDFFNNHSTAVTVAGHQTTDLFRWAKRFVDNTEVRFTWLLQPRVAEGADAWIPYAVVGIGVLSVFLMLGVLGREGLGPWSSLADRRLNENQPSANPGKRSLHANEEG